jgi:pyridoxine 4-dehydrogenase
LQKAGIAYVPFFPLGGFSPLQSSVLSDVASTVGATPMQVALAWLLVRSPNVLLIPGTGSLAHLRCVVGSRAATAVQMRIKSPPLFALYLLD